MSRDPVVQGEILRIPDRAARGDPGAAVMPAGEHQVRMEFVYDGGGLGRGGTVTLYLDGKRVGEGRVEATVPLVFTADETCDLGSEFSGRVDLVQIDVGEDAEDPDHLISPRERLRVAMARQ